MKSKTFIEKAFPNITKGEDKMLNLLHAKVAAQEFAPPEPSANVSVFPFAIRNVDFRSDLKNDAGSISNRGSINLNIHAFGIYYRRFNSSPNGRFTLTAGGTVTPFLPGDFYKVEAKSWQLVRQTLGVESPSVNNSTGSYYGEANFVFMTDPTARYDEAENDLGYFRAVSLLGDMFKPGPPNVQFPTYVTIAADTYDLNAPDTGKSFYAGGFRRLRVFYEIVDAAKLATGTLYLMSANFNAVSPSGSNAVNTWYNSTIQGYALEGANWSAGVPGVSRARCFDINLGDQSFTDVYLQPFVKTLTGTGSGSVNLIIQGIA